MPIDELVNKYMKEASEYGMEVQYYGGVIMLIRILIKGRNDYFVNIWVSNGKVHIQLIKKVFKFGLIRALNEEEYRPLSDDEPEPSLKYVREFIKRTIEGAGIHWYEDEIDRRE
nr:MAG TPA: hypothetical protein [Caudoviricetes sp.]